MDAKTQSWLIALGVGVAIGSTLGGIAVTISGTITGMVRMWLQLFWRPAAIFGLVTIVLAPILWGAGFISGQVLWAWLLGSGASLVAAFLASALGEWLGWWVEV
jgi:hypothetical protein